ncbi:hypothetical protein [uncultured Metabacillus sp.]|uniref:hypothetical protein n=1 Tax=Metabacillus sp. Hm71 TaxID=3450743 RepID=UPI002620518E|nr:hypothetical protein [uncultured Metabacillus sp.]
MGNLTMILGIIALLILAASLIYTIKVGRLVGARKSNMDTQINEKVQEHPYMRNPVFLTYVIFGILALAFIFYLAYTVVW